MQFTVEKDRAHTTVLVIEDDNYTLECLSDFLEMVGFQVVQASNGRDGVEHIERNLPDIVLTDIIMPEMTGLDILKFMQSYSSETPVIVISGTESLDDVTQCLKLGAWDYIIKPVYDYSVLEMSISRALEKKQLIEENRRYREYLEEEVIRRSDELLRSTVRFKTLFNLASDLMFIYDQEGRIIDCNEQAVCGTGYTRKQLLTMDMRDLVIKSDAENLSRIIARLPTRNNTIMYETRVKRHDGSEALMEQHISIIPTDATPLVLAICRDITERRRTELEREELKKKIVASQKMELVGMLAGGIAHDFNNVLTALTGYVGLLQAQLENIGGKPLDYANRISDIAAKGQALTGRLMSFIRKKREELSQVDIHKALRETETLMRPNAKLVTIKLELDAREYTVLGDESQIQNAFLNLGLNARDAMPNGGTLTFKTDNEIDVGTDRKGTGYIAIDVTDTGCGMDEETVKKIFEPLFTTKAPGKGTGLGLPGVLYCVRNMHGTIDVVSEPGHGTTLKIILPLYCEEAMRKIDMSGKGALVATEHDETANLITERLKREGINVRCFSSAPAVLGELKKTPGKIGAVIVDCELPLFDEKSFADEVNAVAPQTLVVKTFCKEQITIGSNKDLAAFINTPINSERFFESVVMHIKESLREEKT